MPNNTISRYKAGQKVEIINTIGGHCFKVGEIVTLIKSGSNHQPWRGNSVSLSCNWLYEKNFKPIERKKPEKTGELHSKFECCNCGEMFQEDDIFDHDGVMYCQECESEEFICCEHCSEFSHTEQALEVNGQWFCCDSCANEAGYYQCSECNDWHGEADAYSDPDGNNLCQSCYDESYCQCSECGDTCSQDDVTNGYCENCREYDEDRLIKDYAYRPSKFLFDKMPWENTIYLGIELEVECPGMDVDECAGKVMKWLEEHKVNDRVYIKEDGSLRNGFELVFMPATLEAIEARFPMKEFVTYLKRIGLDSHDCGRCGLHVHLSKAKMSDRDLYSGKLFFYQCKDQILKFSARDSTGFFRFDESLPENGIQQDHGRYSAFNTAATTNTVEIRVFRGTLEYDRLSASLQFSDLFGEYMQDKSVTFLKENTGAVIWQDFLAYAGKAEKYQQFLGYVKQKGII